MGGYNLYVVRLSLILFLGSVLCSACDERTCPVRQTDFKLRYLCSLEIVKLI